MRHAAYRHIVIMEGGAELHTRKGWRGLSRPRGTNKRRKLTPAAYVSAPLSRANRVWQSTKAAPKSVWTRLKGRYEDWLDQRAAARLKLFADETAAAAEAAKGAVGKVAHVTRA